MSTTLSNENRPFCPKCKKHLELIKVNSYRNSELYWSCNCLIRLESEIEFSTLVPDHTYDLEED